MKEMNRHYDREQYLSLIRYARSVMPDVSFTSDVIVGFPGETYEEFQDTLSLIREVEFTSLFTFIYSPRQGTKAAKMPDPISHEEKTRWFAELLKVQEEVAEMCIRDRFYPLTEEEIAEYVAMGESRGRAGAYGIEGIGVVLVESICGDYSNIVGLPVAETIRRLHRLLAR